MLITERRVQLPTGEGGQLNRLANINWAERLVELIPVKNEVIWVNPNFPNLPFNLRLNQESPLGLFAKKSFSQEPAVGRLMKGNQAGEIWPEHHNRSALLGRVIIADDIGDVYRDVDLKGMGYVKNALIGAANEMKPTVSSDLKHPSRVNGLVSLKEAEYDRDISEEFHTLGVGTSRTLAIIKLSEIILSKKRVPIKTLKNNCVVPEDFDPVIEVRAFKNKARIRDYVERENGNFLFEGRPTIVTQNMEFNGYLRDGDIANSLLLDAKIMVSQELGLTEIMIDEDYFKWLAQTIGRNTALMHKNDWTHGYLNAHNLTLTGDIVDLDSVTLLVEPEEQRDDFISAFKAILTLYVAKTLPSFLDHTPLEKQFINAYESFFPPEGQMAYFDRKRDASLK